jgi:hypothetical protein
MISLVLDDLNRVMLGIPRSVHFRIAELHRRTALDKLSDRRQQSLYKFVPGVVQKTIQTGLRHSCIKGTRSYCMRSQGFVVPRFDTEIGRQRM